MFVMGNATMRRIDQQTIAAGTPGLVLMERAGMGAARAIMRHEEWLLGTTLVVCGAGNNGGDGLVVARLLFGEGHPVRVLLAAAMSELKGDAATNLRRVQDLGIEVEELGSDPDATLLRAHEEHLGRLLVDAVLGTGFVPPLRPPLDDLMRTIATLGRRIVALDGPSGLNGDSGEVDAVTPYADLTLSFGFPRWGQFLAPGRARCGRIERVDLELSRSLVESNVQLDDEAGLFVDRALAAGWWSPRAIDAHKYDAGAVLAVGAAAGMAGAIALACRGAYRTGAGLVAALVPGSQRIVVAEGCLEALVYSGEETATGGLSPSALPTLSALLARKAALLLGPGGGADLATAQFFLEAAELSRIPLVIDADALNAWQRLQRRPKLSAAAVLTPHSGELARLLGLDQAELQHDRRGLLRRAARELGAVILHKGAPTFVADPDGSLAVIGSGGPGLATAGSGDVLAGAVAALLAGGQPPFVAACLAAYLHGRAGDRCEAQFGVSGMMASDLLPELARACDEVERDHR